MRPCDNLSVGPNGLELVECPGTVERWCWWSTLCRECRRKVREARVRAGFEWWDCPPKPYLRRAFQLLGWLLHLLAFLSSSPRLLLRASTLCSFGYWMSREHFERALSGEPTAHSYAPEPRTRPPS